jgi:N-acetylmuramoyl-L-alanine amidase
VTLSGLDVLALTVYGEARGEAIEGKIAVANIIRNRLKTHRWGLTYERVCLAPMQFSCWTPKGGAANYAIVKALAAQILAGQQPADPILAECYWIAAGIQSGAARDNVQGATFYFVTRSTVPAWAVGHLPVCVIGAHSFFAGIS